MIARHAIGRRFSVNPPRVRGLRRRSPFSTHDSEASLSTDERVTKDLVQTLEDGKGGFAKAADRLQESDRSDLASTFREFSAQRASMSDELQALAEQYGDHIDEDGSVAATLHRGWMAVKDALAGSDDPQGVLDAAEQGEDHALSEYDKALKHDDLSEKLRNIIQRQRGEIKTTHDAVRALRDQAKAA
jgi:uncharacterized protein (TIGR02284 family)